MVNSHNGSHSPNYHKSRAPHSACTKNKFRQSEPSGSRVPASHTTTYGMRSRFRMISAHQNCARWMPDSFWITRSLRQYQSSRSVTDQSTSLFLLCHTEEAELLVTIAGSKQSSATKERGIGAEPKITGCRAGLALILSDWSVIPSLPENLKVRSRFLSFFHCPVGAMLTLLEPNSIESLDATRCPHQLNSGPRRAPENTKSAVQGAIANNAA